MAACIGALALALAAPALAHQPRTRFGTGRIVASAARATSELLRPDPTLVGAGKHRAVTLKLSDERQKTVWATPRRWDWVRRRPVAGSAPIRRLHAYTEDGFPEVYIVLAARRTSDGVWWVQVRLPMRPNGTTGWVPRRAMRALHLVHTLLVVNRRTKHAAFWSNGRKIWRARVGTGKASTPTPPGHFWIREGFGVVGDSVYGPYAFGTSDYSVLTDWPGGGVVGIHGTDQPYLIPGHPSHGCIRMHNADISWLSRHMPVGTPLYVL